MKGRPPNNIPATAYDYRRCIALVQVLASAESDKAIVELCELWGVERVEDRGLPPYRGRYYTNVWATIANLARHALEYSRKDTP